MTSSVLAAAVIAAAGFGTTLTEESKSHQNQVFQHFWGTEFEWTFESLPEKGGVPRARLPYSGYIYPDTSGGTRKSLRKYDRAYHGGRSLAEDHEKWDTTAFKEPIERRGPLGLMVWGKRMGTPDWYGHCNGWAAASIRHAEPQENVVHNGVVFTPADIKALLAEIYIYNEHIDLSGGGEEGEAMHPAMLHAVVTNWMGRGAHPLGMESDLSDEKWNYPAYAFNLAYARRTATKIEVKLNLAYMLDSSEEYDESPRYRRMKTFHYLLTLNAAGEIIGGSYFDDSSKIEMLWLPLRPRELGEEGNEEGNPYLSTGEVLSLWRKSVPKELRANWPVVDPSAEDRVVVVGESEGLIPLGHRVSTEVAAREVETTDAGTSRAGTSNARDTITVFRRQVSADKPAEPAEDAPPEAYWPPVHGIEE